MRSFLWYTNWVNGKQRFVNISTQIWLKFYWWNWSANFGNSFGLENKICWNRPQVSISSMFYDQLLHVQIPNALKKGQSSCQSFLRFWDLCLQKLLEEHWWNWHPRGRFHQHSTYSFYARSYPKRNNSVKLSVSFYAFGSYARNRCT